MFSIWNDCNSNNTLQKYDQYTTRNDGHDVKSLSCHQMSRGEGAVNWVGLIQSFSVLHDKIQFGGGGGFLGFWVASVLKSPNNSGISSPPQWHLVAPVDGVNCYFWHLYHTSWELSITVCHTTNKVKWENKSKQECIPVGCVPSAAVAARGGVNPSMQWVGVSV